MRRFGILVLGFVTVLMMVMPAQAAAKGHKDDKDHKVEICHATGNGSYHAINVSENAVPAHLNHGDSLVGDPVPGMTGYVFGEDCSAEMSGPAVGCYENDDDTQQDLLYIGPVDTATNSKSSMGRPPASICDINEASSRARASA